MDWEIFSKFIAPPILGAFAGLLTIYANWGIEKRKQRLAYRKELVQSWRTKLLASVPDKQNIQLGHGGPRYGFMRSPEYASLRQHLDPKFLETIEQPATVVVGDDNWLRRRLIEEIGRIEKEWKLA